MARKRGIEYLYPGGKTRFAIEQPARHGPPLLPHSGEDESDLPVCIRFRRPGGDDGLADAGSIAVEQVGSLVAAG